MLLSQDKSDASYTITAYEPGRIEVNKQPYQAPLLLTPESLEQQALPTQFADLQQQHVHEWLQRDVDVIVVGYGAQARTPPIHLMKAAMERGKVLEFMDTRAACHTFVVLASEHRKVLAVLYP